MPAVDVKEEEVNKLSCSSVHVGGWSVNLDGEHYMHIYYFHMNNVHGHFLSTPMYCGRPWNSFTTVACGQTCYYILRLCFTCHSM